MVPPPGCGPRARLSPKTQSSIVPARAGPSSRPVRTAATRRPNRRRSDGSPVGGRSEGANRVGACPRCRTSSSSTPPSTRPNTSGCGWWSRSGSCWPTCRSPTWCCGCPTPTRTSSGPPLRSVPRPDRRRLLDDVVGDLIAYAPEHLVSEAYLSEQDHPDQRRPIRCRTPGRHPRHPGGARRPGHRRRRAAHQPARHPRAQLAGTRLPGLCRRPGRDGFGGRVPDRRATCSIRASIRGSATGSSGWTPTETCCTPARTRSAPTAGWD